MVALIEGLTLLILLE